MANAHLSPAAPEDETYFNAIFDRTPMGRLAEPEEVASVAAFLSLPAAAFIVEVCVTMA